MEQHGMKVVPLAAAAQLQRKNGETIDLAAARALGARGRGHAGGLWQFQSAGQRLQYGHAPGAP